MIWRDTIAHKAERYWQMLIHVNHSLVVLANYPASRIEACWAGADDGEPEGSV